MAPPFDPEFGTLAAYPGKQSLLVKESKRSSNDKIMNGRQLDKQLRRNLSH
jgi:hypothetical protein